MNEATIIYQTKHLASKTNRPRILSCGKLGSSYTDSTCNTGSQVYLHQTCTLSHSTCPRSTWLLSDPFHLLTEEYKAVQPHLSNYNY